MRLLLAGLAAALLAAPALAQQPALEKYQRTKYQVLEQSLEALLNAGYTIVNLSVIPAGANFLLRQDRKWVICSLKGFEQNGQTAVGSQCVALN